MNLFETRNVIVITAALLLATGCCAEKKQKVSVNDYFQADNEPRSVQKIFAQQHANGAREDGTLYAGHFSGDELNSLGLQKMQTMLDGAERGPVNIYLSVPKDNTYGPREASVIAQLSARGLASSDYTLTAGDNPGTSSPAVYGMSGLVKQRGATSSSDSSSVSATAAK